MNSKTCPPAQEQAGFILLEVLVSILIFAIGVLSIVGLQVNSIKQSSAAMYRTEASLLANDLIGKMWAADRTPAALSTNFGPSGAAFKAWLANVNATLPGVTANPPTIEFPGAPAPVGEVHITLSWKAPNEPASEPVHHLTVVTLIK